MIKCFAISGCFAFMLMKVLPALGVPYQMALIISALSFFGLAEALHGELK